MDVIAERLGMILCACANGMRSDRRYDGDRPEGRQGLQRAQVLREAGRRTRFSKKRKTLKGSNRGIGLSLFFHGSGFTGGGEVKLASKASLALTARGVEIRAASTEIGQGTRTMHAQIVADTLGIPYEQVAVSVADTAVVPDSGPTVAVATCMIGASVAALRRRHARAARTADAGRLLERARRIDRHQTA